MTSNASADLCPACDSDLTGEPIPEQSREHYGAATHFTRRVGRVWNDRVQEWHCPDCGAAWSRWTGEIVRPSKNKGEPA